MKRLHTNLTLSLFALWIGVAQAAELSGPGKMDENGMMMDGGMMMSGWMMLVCTLFGLLIFAVLVLAILALIKYLRSSTS